MPCSVTWCALMAWPHGPQHESRGTGTYPTGDFTSTKSIKIMKACSFGGSLFHPPHLQLVSRLNVQIAHSWPLLLLPQHHYISRNKSSMISKSLENNRGGWTRCDSKKLLPPRRGQFSECPTWTPATTWRSLYKVRVGILCDLNQSIYKLGTEG
jgi:hypothetical protein